MEPKVSVVIPAYNAEKFIERCLKSLLNQSMDEIEVILIDDGSTDNTLELCRSIAISDRRLRVFTKENEGQGIARNYGMSRATGSYVGFVDADDYVELDMYEKMYAFAKKYHADMVYSYAEGEDFLEDKNFLQIPNGMLANTPEMIFCWKKLYMGGLPTDSEDSPIGMSVWRSIYKRDLLEEYKIVFESERRVNSEDLLFNLDFVSKSNTVAILNGNYYHYCHDNEVSFSLKLKPDRYRMFETLFKEQKKRCSSEEELLRCTRRYLANVRVCVVEVVRWITKDNLKVMKGYLKKIVQSDVLRESLRSYPIDKLPFKQKVYFYLMKVEALNALIVFAKLRYRCL